MHQGVRRRPIWTPIVALLGLVQSLVRGAEQECPTAVPGRWSLTFEDQFPLNTATDTGLAADVWTFDVGTRDMSDPDNPGPELWGNGEPQYYTDRCPPTESSAAPALCFKP